MTKHITDTKNSMRTFGTVGFQSLTLSTIMPQNRCTICHTHHGMWMPGQALT